MYAIRTFLNPCVRKPELRVFTGCVIVVEKPATQTAVELVSLRRARARGTAAASKNANDSGPIRDYLIVTFRRAQLFSTTVPWQRG